MQVDRADPQTYLAQALTSPQLPDELKPFYHAFERFYANRRVRRATLFAVTRTTRSLYCAVDA